MFTLSGLAAFKRPILSNQSADFYEIKSIVTRRPPSILGKNRRINEPQSFRVIVDNFLGRNVVPMPKGIKFGAREVSYSVATLKLKDLCAGLPVFENFEK